MRNRTVIMRFVVLCLLLYALTSLVSGYRSLSRTEQSARELTAEAERLEAEQAELTQKLSQENWDEEMRRLAWERLGMVMPGEKIFYFTQKQEDQE